MRWQETAREERRTAHAALPKRRLRAAQGPAAARTVCVSGPLVSDRLCQLTVDRLTKRFGGVRSCGAPVVRASAMVVRCFRTRHQRGPVPPFVVRVAFRAVKVNLTSLHSHPARRRQQKGNRCQRKQNEQQEPSVLTLSVVSRSSVSSHIPGLAFTALVMFPKASSCSAKVSDLNTEKTLKTNGFAYPVADHASVPAAVVAPVLRVLLDVGIGRLQRGVAVLKGLCHEPHIDRAPMVIMCAELVRWLGVGRSLPRSRRGGCRLGAGR